MKNHHIKTFLTASTSLAICVLLLMLFSTSAIGQELSSNRGRLTNPVKPGTSKAVDTDNDGVIDQIDKDDDNDGILDIVENNREPMDIVDWYNPVNVSIDGNTLIFDNGLTGWANGTYSTPFYKMDLLDDYIVGFSPAQVTGEVVVGFGLDEKNNTNTDVDFGIHFTNNSFRVILSGEYATNDDAYGEGDPFFFTYFEGILTIMHKEEVVYSKQLDKSMPFYVDTSFLGRKSKAGVVLKEFTLASLRDIDTDQDGDINSIDRDSDNDNCVDVVEAGFQDDDGDGVLGTGVPTVDSSGLVTSEIGYEDPGSAYLNASISDACTPGIVINTSLMPSAIYEIVTGSETISNLVSGTSSSENTIIVTQGLNEIFVRVASDDDHTSLDLKVTTLGASSIDEVGVLTNGQWLKFSPEFYKIDGNTIYFKNEVEEAVNPFKANFTDGVIYNVADGLRVEVEGTINITGATMKIYGPNGFTDGVDITTGIRTFIWDGSQAAPGKYRFSISINPDPFSIDNAKYVGQFIIQ